MVIHFDFVDRGLPTIEQFHEGLNFLHWHGFVERKGKQFIRTERGNELCNSEQRQGEYKTALAIAKRLVALPPAEPKQEIITKKEAAFAVKCYGRLGCLLIFWPF